MMEQKKNDIGLHELGGDDHGFWNIVDTLVAYYLGIANLFVFLLSYL